MKQILFIALSILILGSCGRNIKVPETIIQKEKFTKILADIHIADATINNLKVNDKSDVETLEAYYNYIFDKHSITAEEFKTSLDFYARNAELLDEIYEEILTELKKMEEVKKYKDEGEKTDSVKNAPDNKPINK